MDDVRIDAVAALCLCCKRRLHDRHRVVPTYLHASLDMAAQFYEVGLMVGEGARPMWRHVDCNDPTLLRYQMRPELNYCVKCKKRFERADAISPVYQVINPKATNPNDASDIDGMYLGDRIHFAHASCTDPTFTQNSPLLVIA